MVSEKVKKVALSADGKQLFEQGYRNGKTHYYRRCCQIVLLKLSGYKSEEKAGGQIVVRCV